MDSFEQYLKSSDLKTDPSRKVKQRDIAILFSDLVGSTELFQQRGDAYALMLVQRNTELLLPEIVRFGGRLTKTIGAALMATFPKAKKALACAMAMQRALADYNQEAPPADRLQVRMGVHYGQAIIETADVYGDAVNTAARIEAQAGGGEIFTSLRTWQTATALDTEVELLGDFALKGLAQKVNLVKVLWRAEDIEKYRALHLEENIIPELATRLVRRRSLLVLGGLSLGPRGGTVKGRIGKKLADELGIEERRAKLSHLASLYEDENDHGEMLNAVVRGLEEERDNPTTFLPALAEVPFDVILSTDLDDRLERVLQAAGRQVRKVVWLREANPNDCAPGQVMLIKLLGDVEEPDSLAITEAEIDQRLNQLRLAPEELLAALATRYLLFMGFRWRDPHFKRIHACLSEHVSEGLRKATGISSRVAAGVRGTWRRRGLLLTQADEREFADKLAAAVAPAQMRLEQEQDHGSNRLVRSAGVRQWKRPYKFLSFYTEEDQEIFFGRQSEARKLFSQVVSHRLVVLHAPSGVGKTSLLHAGVIPALRLEGFAVMARRVFKDPEREIREGVAGLLGEAEGKEVTADWMAGALSSKLSELLREACSLIGKPIVIILDQFEEFFLKLPKRARKVFIEQLSLIKKDRSLNVSFVLSLRHDFLHYLAEFKSRVPDVFHNDFGLEKLSPEGVDEAIREPAKLAGLNFQAGLVARIMTDLGTVGSEPPQLQIICDRLYDELAEGEREITDQHYDKLGGARGILGRYLDRFIDARTPAGKDLGRQVLKALVTSLGTRSVASAELIAKETNRSTKAVNGMLGHLLDARLIRKMVGDEGDSYELSHEYLIEEIGTWIEAKDRTVKKVRELLQQELINFERFGLLMSPGRVGIIQEHKEALNMSGPSRQLVQKSVRHNRRKRRWLFTGMALVLSLGLGLSVTITRELRLGQCRGAASHMVGVWDPAIQGQIREAFLATGVPFAADAWKGVDRVIGQYASGWLAMHTEACEATRVSEEQSEAALDLRMACLTGRREDLLSLTAVFVRPDAQVVEKAVSAAASLSPLRGCADLESLQMRVRPPDDPDLRLLVKKKRTRLSEIKALNDLGKYQQALTQARTLSAEIAKIEYLPLRAEAQFRLGILQYNRGIFAACAQSLDSAIWAAEASGHDPVAAAGLIALMRLHFEQDQFEQVEKIGRRARALLVRLREPVELQTRWAMERVRFFGARARFDEAATLLANTLDRLEANLGQEHPLVATAYQLAGVLAARQGRAQQARSYTQRALSIRQRTLGPQHPAVASVLLVLGNRAADESRYHEYEKLVRRALAIWEDANGKNHPLVGQALVNVGAALRFQGKFDEAKPYFERALSIFERAYGPEHSLVGAALENLGELALLTKQLSEARRLYQRALAVDEKTMGATHPKLAYDLVGLGNVCLESGETDRALVHLERAYALQGYDQVLQAGICFSLARALWKLGHSQDRARKLAHQAHRFYSGRSQAHPTELASVESWLKQHAGY